MMDSPDAYREEIAPRLLPGFARTSTWDIDESKTVITGTIVDTQLGPNAPPAWVTVATASHSYNSVPGSMGSRWTGTLKADFEVGRPDDIALAAQAYFALLKDRLASAATM